MLSSAPRTRRDALSKGTSMTVHGQRSPRYGLALVAVGVGIAAANGHTVAWADAGRSDGSGQSAEHAKTGPKTGPTRTGPPESRAEKRADRHRTRRDDSAASSAAPSSDDKTSAAQPASADPDTASATPTHRWRPSQQRPLRQAPSKVFAPREARSATPRVTSGDRVTSVDDFTVSEKVSAVTTSAVATAAAATAATTPNPPGPLSPIGRIEAVPGRIVNAVLQALDLTSSANGPKSPLDFAPIDEALFAAFRRIEDIVGLDKTPVAQQVPPTESYKLPTDAPTTPTVSQFLDAAAAEYVFGGTPGDLKPFTVDGKQMTSTNELTGESAKAWVTPQNQIIIAYQGTTGGTNLLANPLIAISQAVTDAQIIFTNTTPQAFTDSLTFERQVQTQAEAQGYTSNDIFVTGHSLGGWEAEYVAQQTGLSGIGFESPGINTVTDGNGVKSGFVNVETYGDTAAYLATDLPALQPFMPAYVPGTEGGGTKPHYGSIIMIGDPDATNPLANAASLWGPNPVGDIVFAVDILGNFLEHHLPGMQAYNLGVDPDPGVVPWLGATMGPVEDGWSELTIPQLKAKASTAGQLITP
jgi:hypothetical protein